ncbi:F-box/kelch-repeat protein At3g06240-like [Camellia sinensis]|uniref:F-box/kelch-repeat protein At3g06240-like n=1 Tax=Camellia sinensis TaxID=4442 RepID=UPI001036368E|nr:F-box/kelch-repeat protein At3g06240-like [Camellia sinensis]
MSDYVPREVLIEILARLPVKSLLRCSSVCKSWYSSITNPSFTTTHLNQTKSNTQLLIIKYTFLVPNQERHISCSDDETCCDEFVELENPFHSSSKSFKIVGSCNGLLCISDYHGSDCAFLWNPSIRRFLTLPESGYSVTDSDLQFVFGFGFDRISNDYKVVKIGYLNDLKTRGSVLCKMELYALSTLSWRPICVVDFRFELSINTWSVFVNGAVHWVVFDPAKERGFGILIVAFDMGNEVFREMALPNYQPNGWFYRNAAVAVLGESLAVINFESDLVPANLMCNFHIWVMEEYGVIESWTK